MTPADLDRFYDAAVQRVIELECGALGDHCLALQLRPILVDLVNDVLRDALARVARLEQHLDAALD